MTLRVHPVERARVALASLALACVACVGATSARAHTSSPVIEAVLHDPQPSGWAADALRHEDLEVRWDGPQPSAVGAIVVPDSVEWVRVDEQLVLPRVRLRLKHAGCTGTVAYEEHHQSLAASGATDVQVVVLSGMQHPVRLSARCGDVVVEQRLALARRARAGREGRVAVDVGCSTSGLTATLTGGPDDDWVYVGCRRVFEGGLLDRTHVLDVRVHWDRSGGDVRLGGQTLSPDAASVWSLRLRPDDGPTVLEAGGRRLELRHRLAAGARFGTLGFGLGPALYRFTAPGGQFDTVSPFAAAYVAYRLSDTSRLVAFGGFHVNEKRDLDVGVYLNSETLRFFDRRGSVNVLLGAQLIGFDYKDGYATRLGVPQGAEVLLRDVGWTGWNVLAGGFFYPPINNKFYASVWLRYGTSRLFLEANGMFRQEPLTDGSLTKAETIGISVGAPFLFFL